MPVPMANTRPPKYTDAQLNTLAKLTAAAAWAQGISVYVVFYYHGSDSGADTTLLQSLVQGQRDLHDGNECSTCRRRSMPSSRAWRSTGWCSERGRPLLLATIVLALCWRDARVRPLRSGEIDAQDRCGMRRAQATWHMPSASRNMLAATHARNSVGSGVVPRSGATQTARRPPPGVGREDVHGRPQQRLWRRAFRDAALSPL